MLLYHVTTLLGILFEILISKMNRAKHPLYCEKNKQILSKIISQSIQEKPRSNQRFWNYTNFYSSHD